MPINYNTCRICASGLLDDPQLEGWYKCPSCCFSKIKLQYITPTQYFMGRDKRFPKELTEEIQANVIILLEKVNAILYDLKTVEVEITSGWRPSAINSQISNASKKSHHMTGCAVDIKDDDKQTLASKILTQPDLLAKYSLWLEDPSYTKGKNTNWVHLDIGTRADRDLRMFKPR